MNPLLEYILFAFSSLFIIVDPLATIPASAYRRGPAPRRAEERTELRISVAS